MSLEVPTRGTERHSGAQGCEQQMAATAPYHCGSRLASTRGMKEAKAVGVMALKSEGKTEPKRQVATYPRRSIPQRQVATRSPQARCIPEMAAWGETRLFAHMPFTLTPNQPATQNEFKRTSGQSSGGTLNWRKLNWRESPVSYAHSTGLSPRSEFSQVAE